MRAAATSSGDRRCAVAAGVGIGVCMPGAGGDGGIVRAELYDLLAGEAGREMRASAGMVAALSATGAGLQRVLAGETG